MFWPSRPEIQITKARYHLQVLCTVYATQITTRNNDVLIFTLREVLSLTCCTSTNDKCKVPQITWHKLALIELCRAGVIMISNTLVTQSFHNTNLHPLELYSVCPVVCRFREFNLDWNPAYLMVDKSDAERAAIRFVFPFAIILLCDFHRLQAWNRWLINRDHGVPASM